MLIERFIYLYFSLKSERCMVICWIVIATSLDLLLHQSKCLSCVINFANSRNFPGIFQDRIQGPR